MVIVTTMEIAEMIDVNVSLASEEISAKQESLKGFAKIVQIVIIMVIVLLDHLEEQLANALGDTEELDAILVYIVSTKLMTVMVEDNVPLKDFVDVILDGVEIPVKLE